LTTEYSNPQIDVAADFLEDTRCTEKMESRAQLVQIQSLLLKKLCNLWRL